MKFGQSGAETELIIRRNLRIRRGRGAAFWLGTAMIEPTTMQRPHQADRGDEGSLLIASHLFVSLGQQTSGHVEQPAIATDRRSGALMQAGLLFGRKGTA